MQTSHQRSWRCIHVIVGGIQPAHITLFYKIQFSQEHEAAKYSQHGMLPYMRKRKVKRPTRSEKMHLLELNLSQVT
jgi:hypothetical protein